MDLGDSVLSHDDVRPVLGVHLSTDTVVASGRLTGDLDRLSGSRLTEVLARLRSDGHHRVSLDVSQLDFLDAGGLRVLADADEGFRVIGGRLVLTGAPPRILRILKVTGLEGLVDAAVA